MKDGRTLPVWSVKNGHLVCTGKGFGFLRYDRCMFADFVFYVEFRMALGCNSGLGIRTRSFDPAWSRATRSSILNLRRVCMQVHLRYAPIIHYAPVQFSGPTSYPSRHREIHGFSG